MAAQDIGVAYVHVEPSGKGFGKSIEGDIGDAVSKASRKGSNTLISKIGGAFGKIVSSLVNDILMPPIGALIGNTDFSQLRLDISKVRDVTSNAMHSVGDMVTGGGDPAQAAAAAEPIYWNYGAFIQQCVDFTILALCVFLMVKLMNRLMKKKEEAPAPVPEPPAPTKEELLLTEIRDLLKEQKK